MDIPRRDPLQGDISNTAVDDDEEPTLPVTITGPSSLAEDVRAEITAIIATKKSKSTQRVRDLPVHMIPFIADKLPKYQSQEITLVLNEPNREVVVSGEREIVVRTIGQIRDDITDWEQSLESISLSIPKRQHRLLVGNGAEVLMVKAQCAVIPTSFDEPGDLVTVWGKSDNISVALGAVYEMARSKHSSEVVLPGPLAYASQIQTYLTRSAYLKNLSTSRSGLSIYVTSPALVQKTASVHVEFIGEKVEIDEAVKELNELIRKLEGALREVEIDWLVHKTLIGKNGKKSVFSVCLGQ